MNIIIATMFTFLLIIALIFYTIFEQMKIHSNINNSIKALKYINNNSCCVMRKR